MRHQEIYFGLQVFHLLSTWDNGKVGKGFPGGHSLECFLRELIENQVKLPILGKS